MHSTALKANDMWTNTIGQIQDPQAGSNSVIEASIYAPGRGGGGNKVQRQEKAQQLIASGKAKLLHALTHLHAHVAAPSVQSSL